ncbi:phage tail tape measure protein [Escherichia coli]
MNGKRARVNRLLGLGNELLQQRQGLVNVPLRLPQATLDDKQQTALNNSKRELALSRLKGEARERARLGYAADNLGFVGEAYRTSQQNYINNSLDAWRNNQANKPKAHKKTEAEKTEDIYKRLIKQQKEQIALAGQNTELAKMKYQVSQANYQDPVAEAEKKRFCQNAALIDQKELREQLAAYEKQSGGQ